VHFSCPLRAQESFLSLAEKDTACYKLVYLHFHAQLPVNKSYPDQTEAEATTRFCFGICCTQNSFRYNGKDSGQIAKLLLYIFRQRVVGLSTLSVFLANIYQFMALKNCYNYLCV